MASMQLLLVDDEERFLETTKTLLERRGVSVFTATGGLDAMKVLDEHRIDVVVLDVKMPGLDGGEVLRKIKQRYPLVEVVMLTGHATVESAVEGMRLGAFDYVTKPCDVSQLLGKAQEAFDKKVAMEEKIRKAKTERIISHPMAVFEEDDKE